jgi:hypothetical protein
VSSTLEHPVWDNSTVLSGDVVSEVGDGLAFFSYEVVPAA